MAFSNPASLTICRNVCWSGNLRIEFDEVLIAVAVACDDLPHARDHVEGVKIVDPAQGRVGHLAELQHHEPPAGFQDAKRLAERSGGPRDVPDAEADRVDVEARIREGQRHRVPHYPVETARAAFGLGTLAAGGQHGLGQIEHGGVAAPGAFQEAERDVARAAGDIEQLLPGPRCQPIHHGVLPEPVDAAAHHVVHDVVSRGDGVEHAPHPIRLFVLGQRLIAEMRGFLIGVVHGLAVRWNSSLL